MELRNYIVPSVDSYLSSGHISSSDLFDIINNHDGSEAYHSLFDMEPRKDFKGYEGPHYPASGWVVIDIDFGEKLESGSYDIEKNIILSKEVVLNIWNSLELEEEWARIFFSGTKGFHVYIRADYFGITEPSETASKTLKHIITQLARRFKFKFDTGIYHPGRKFRLPGSVNPKSGLYKIEVPYKQFVDITPAELMVEARHPNSSDLDFYIPARKKYNLLPDIKEVQEIKKTPEKSSYFGGEIITEDESFSNTIKNKPCITKMVEVGGIEEGFRHNSMLAVIKDSVDSGLTKDEAIERVINFCDNNELKDRRKQYLKDVELAYTGKFPYKFGCYDGPKYAHCSGTCPLYKKLDKTKRATVTDEPNDSVDLPNQTNENLFLLPNGVSLKHSEIAIQLAKASEGRLIYDITKDRFYTFNKVWNPTFEEDIKKSVLFALKKASHEGFSNNVLNSSFSMMKIIIGMGGAQKLEWKYKNVLPLQNGLLNLDKKTLDPFSEKEMINFILPYEYDEYATSPNFDSLIDFISSGSTNTKQVLLCYLAAVIRGFSHLEKYLELVGSAGAGKSSYMEVACALVGEKNVFTSQLRMLGTNRFETAGLYEKRLAIFPDEKDHLAEGTDVFKAMIGKDTIRYEQKNKQQLEGFKFTGMVIVSCNNAMTFEDNSHAIPRRRITVHIDQVLSEEKRDPDFKRKLLAEIPGILNKLIQIPVEEITSVLTNKNQTLNESNKRALVETNPIYEWFDNCIVIDQNSSLYIGSADSIEHGSYTGQPKPNTEYMYPNYLNWCRAAGLNKPVSVKKFSNMVRGIIDVQRLPVIREKRTMDGWKYRGLALRSEENSQLLTPITKSVINSF